MIYAVEILGRMFIKFGFCKADDAQARIATLQTANPFEIRLVGLTEGTLMQEKALHSSLTSAFARLRIPMPPNEWYPGRVQFMRDMVEVMPFGAGQMLALSEKFSPTLDMGSQKKNKDLLPNIRWPTISERRNEVK